MRRGVAAVRLVRESTRRARCLPRRVVLAMALAKAGVSAADEQDSNIRHAVNVKTGYMAYSQAGVSPQSGANTSNLEAEWGYFAKRDLMTFAAYRVARDADRQRVLYQAGRFGSRYFPISLGAPLTSFRQLAIVRYDFAVKPYVEGGVVMGRYLIDTVFNLAAADYSSEFMGFNFGGGCVFGLTERLALDLELLVESVQGYGTLDFQATTQFITLGLVNYL